MVTLARASWDIVHSVYNLSSTTDRTRKIKEMETLISGVTKVIASFCTFLSLYSAYYLIERRDYKMIVAILTFLVNPMLILEIIGIVSGIFGFYKIYSAIKLSYEYKIAIIKILNLSAEQTKKEGYRFYTFWERKLFGFSAPLETMQRYAELTKNAKNQLFTAEQWSQLEASLTTRVWRDLISGRNHLRISMVSGVGAVYVGHTPHLCWLNQRIVTFSKWLAPRLV